MPTERLKDVDADALRALAHPLRIRMLRLLTMRDRASVTSLAQELGETTGATSYHLRQLARHGFVEEVDEPAPPAPDGSGAPGTRGRRQRWWRIAVDRINVSGFDFLARPDTREAAGFVLREFQAERSRRLANWYATADQWSTGWQHASSDGDFTTQLNQRQLRSLADELSDVVAKYRSMAPGRGARYVDVQYAVFPTDDGSRA